MSISLELRKVYSEIHEFLGLLTDEQRNKIPQELREFFAREKDQHYKKGINPKITIKEQELKEETLGIIAWLNLEYWCEDANEKERLKKVYAKNEKVYQEMLQVAFNPNDIFNKDVVNEKNKQEQIVEYKENIAKRLINKILKLTAFK